MQPRVLVVYLVLLNVMFVMIYGDQEVSSSRNGVTEPHVSERIDTRDRLRGGNDIQPDEQMTAFSVELTGSENKITMPMQSELTVTFKLSVLCRHISDVTTIKIYADFHNPEVMTIGTTEVTVGCVSNIRSDTDSTVVNATPINTSHTAAMAADVDVVDTHVVVNHFHVSKDINVTLYSGRIGLSHIVFDRYFKNDSSVSSTSLTKSLTDSPDMSIMFDVFVLRNGSVLDIVFLVCVVSLTIFEMVAFGTQLEFSTVLKTLKKPLAPLLGFICQSVAMPLIAFGLAKSIETDPLVALGIFVTGICPGGGSSNIYSYLLDGDLSLSITMTTISTLMSLATMPFWLYILGDEFMDKYTLDIPYVDILLTLSVMIIPLVAGIFIKQKLEKLAKIIDRSLTVVLTLLCIAVLTIGIYSSLYLFRLFNWKSILFGCMLPYIGFLIGGLLAFICGQPWTNIKTISLEAGMQNVGIAYILLVNTFSPPLDDMASIVPMAAEVFSPIPPLLTAIFYHVWKKCRDKYKVEAKLNMEDVIEIEEMVELSIEED